MELIHDLPELRKLILENPELPIVVVVGENATCDDFELTYCSDVCCDIEEILDCELPAEYFGLNAKRVYNDREQFEQDISDMLASDDSTADMTDEEFQQRVAEEIKLYEPCWRKVITILSDN